MGITVAMTQFVGAYCKGLTRTRYILAVLSPAVPPSGVSGEPLGSSRVPISHCHSLNKLLVSP